MAYKKWFLSLFYMITSLVCLAVSQPNFTSYFCSDGLGNYTQNSTYQANLNSLLSSLSSNINQFGFYNSSVGANLDRVNAIALCRGDVDPQTCSSCVNNSVQKLIQVCPNQKEAIGWYDQCMLRYSNKPIAGVMATDPTFTLRNTVNSSNPNLFSQEIRRMASSLQRKTCEGSGRKFAVEKSNNSNIEPIYALMQCTPDLDSGECNVCVGWVSNIMSQCCSESLGARVIGPNCGFWYELSHFYNESAIQSSPPSPSPTLPSPKPKGMKYNFLLH